MTNKARRSGDLKKRIQADALENGLVINVIRFQGFNIITGDIDKISISIGSYGVANQDSLYCLKTILDNIEETEKVQFNSRFAEF